MSQFSKRVSLSNNAEISSSFPIALKQQISNKSNQLVVSKEIKNRKQQHSKDAMLTGKSFITKSKAINKKDTVRYQGEKDCFYGNDSPTLKQVGLEFCSKNDSELILLFDSRNITVLREQLFNLLAPTMLETISSKREVSESILPESDTSRFHASFSSNQQINNTNALTKQASKNQFPESVVLNESAKKALFQKALRINCFDPESLLLRHFRGKENQQLFISNKGETFPPKTKDSGKKLKQNQNNRIPVSNNIKQIQSLVKISSGNIQALRIESANKLYLSLNTFESFEQKNKSNKAIDLFGKVMSSKLACRNGSRFEKGSSSLSSSIGKSNRKIKQQATLLIGGILLNKQTNLKNLPSNPVFLNVPQLEALQKLSISTNFPKRFKFVFEQVQQGLAEKLVARVRIEQLLEKQLELLCLLSIQATKQFDNNLNSISDPKPLR